MSTYPIFEITDGTTTISFLSQREGFFMLEWNPSVTELKEDGIFIDNPLVEGRFPVFSRYGNAEEEVLLRARANSHDEMSSMMQDLRKLLRSAREYWERNAPYNNPVYLAARGYNETNKRYAIIKSSDLTGDPNPFGQPWQQGDGFAVAQELTLTIERGHWQDHVPGSSTTIPATMIQDDVTASNTGNYDSNGQRSSAFNTYFSNKQLYSNIARVFPHPSGGSVGSDAFSGSPPHTYMQLDTVGDRMYIGRDTYSLPFDSVILPFAGLSSGSATLSFEYWDGAVWQSLSASPYLGRDLSQSANSDLTLGTSEETLGFRWNQPDDWTEDTLVNVSGDAGAPSTGNFFWVKAEVTATTTSDSLTCNEKMYSACTPYVEIISDDIPGGDLPALLKQKITPYYVVGDNLSRVLWAITETPTPGGYPFTPYINIGGPDNAAVLPGGVSITYGAETTATEDFASTGDCSVYPSGRIAKLSPTATTSTWTDRVSVSFTTNSRLWTGKFRAIVRVVLEIGGDTSEWQFRLAVNNSATTLGNSFISRVVKYPSSGISPLTLYDVAALDFGVIDTTTVRNLWSIDEGSGSTIIRDLDINIQARNPDSATTDVGFIDMILMPVDAAFTAASGIIRPHSDSLIIDSARDPKSVIKSYTIDNSNDDTYAREWVVTGDKQPFLETGKSYRLWFYIDRNPDSPVTGIVNQYQAEAVGRYLSFRGES